VKCEAYFTGATTTPEAGKPRQSLHLGKGYVQQTGLMTMAISIRKAKQVCVHDELQTSQ